MCDDTDAGRPRGGADGSVGEGGTGSNDSSISDLAVGVGMVYRLVCLVSTRSAVVLSSGGIIASRGTEAAELMKGDCPAGLAAKVDEVFEGGDMRVLRLSGLGAFSDPPTVLSFALASHCPRTKSTDLPPPCLPPSLDGLLFSSAPLNPSVAFTILATFRRMGVLGGDTSAREDRDDRPDCGDALECVEIADARSSSRV